MPDARAEGAPEPFVARYSVGKLIGWAAASGGMAAGSLAMALSGSGTGGRVLGALGVLLFGAIALVPAIRLFDRRAQVVIDERGLYVRAHGATRIALRSIRSMRTDVITPQMTMLCLYLHKPARYPIETRQRRFIRWLNGEAGTHAFFGDVWIWQTHLDQPVDAVIRAIWAHRPMTEFERRLDALSARP